MNESRHDDALPPGALATPKMIIFGRSLQRQAGHYFNELLGYKKAAEALGRQIRIFLPHNCSPELASLLSAKPAFDGLPNISIRPENLRDRIVAFADIDVESIWTALDAENPGQGDVILFAFDHPTIVRGIGCWLGNRSPERRPSVFFRFLGEMVDTKNEGYNGIAPLFRLASADLRTRPGQDRVFFLANNSTIERAVNRVCRRRAFLMPMPKYLGETSPDAVPADPAHHTIYIFINSRSRSIAGDIGKMIRRIRAHDPAVKFLIKLGNHMQQERLVFQNERIANAELLPVEERIDDYLENLSRGTIVLLAHTSQYYRTATSGVFTEAVAFGKPVVVQSGTWMAEQIAAGRGVGALFDEPRGEEISAAVVQVLRNFKQLSAAARDIAPGLRAENSCQRVVELMLDLARTAPDMEPRYRPGDEIDLRDPLDSRCFMHGEWGDTEPWGVWTVGRNAGLSLLIEADQQRPGPWVLRALVMPFLAKNHRRTMVRVSIAGRQVTEWAFDLDAPGGNSMRWCEAAIPDHDGVNRSRPIEISFAVDTPMSPASLGLSSDHRTLGLGFQKLLLTAIDK